MWHGGSLYSSSGAAPAVSSDKEELQECLLLESLARGELQLTGCKNKALSRAGRYFWHRQKGKLSKVRQLFLSLKRDRSPTRAIKITRGARRGLARGREERGESRAGPCVWHPQRVPLPPRG